MARAELRRQIGEPLWGLVEAVGTRLVRVDEITVAPVDGTRRTYRLWFDDGRSLKGRRFKTAARADLVWRILQRAALPSLGRAISHQGDAMLEEWIEGDALVQGRVGHGLIREAGRILGTLHSCPPPSTGDSGFQPVDSREWVRKTADNLRLLHERGLVAAEYADRLMDLVRAHQPGDAPMGVVHRDLCPENLITDARGRLVCVDNGSMSIGALDHDFGRVWYRWPMTAGERAVFMEGYRERSDVPGVGEPSVFWSTTAILNSARTRLGWSAAAAAAALQQLDTHVPHRTP